MFIYVLTRWWDTPDNEGYDVIGVYLNESDAQRDMIRDAAATSSWFKGIGEWEEDMTWTTPNEIHLGFDPHNGEKATIYCWNIERKEVW